MPQHVKDQWNLFYMKRGKKQDAERPAISPEIVNLVQGLDSAVVPSETAAVEEGEMTIKHGKPDEVRLHGYSLC